jgi:5-(carboxyamino)imidazole ribonucleotide synthase
MNREFYGNFTLGILGGGQLGRMLIQEAINLNIDSKVLDPDSNAPCKHLCNEFVNGSLNDFNAVVEFAKNVDVLTIEIEHVSVEALKKIQTTGVKVYPQPGVLEIIQDKGLQKEFYTKHNIPTASYTLINGSSEVNAHFKAGGIIQKLRKGGYDGKGVVLLKDDKDLNKAFDAPSVIEEKVDIEKEISVIVARNEAGEVKAFPIVELGYNSEANLVEYLISPAGVSKDFQQQAESIAKNVANSLGIVGILAVEMFITKSGKILVNEVAPRPHNSGHQSIEGNVTSQYEQHLRAILGLPLGSTEITLPSVMVNLLGEKGHEGEVVYEGLKECLAIDGVKVHLYGKKSTKPFRKMGHVTIIDKDIKSAMVKAEKVKNTLKVKSK